jgi:hypothetical protein
MEIPGLENSSLRFNSILWKNSNNIELTGILKLEDGESDLPIKIDCKDVVETYLLFDSDFSNKYIKNFFVSEEHQLLWHYEQYHAVYGKAPLPDPYRFYWDFEDILRYELKIPRRAIDYLNVFGNLKNWVTACYGRAFMMMTVPEHYLPYLVEVFYAQAFEYYFLECEEKPKYEKLKLLSLDTNWIICQEISITTDKC